VRARRASGVSHGCGRWCRASFCGGLPFRSQPRRRENAVRGETAAGGRLQDGACGAGGMVWCRVLWIWLWQSRYDYGLAPPTRCDAARDGVFSCHRAHVGCPAQFADRCLRSMRPRSHTRTQTKYMQSHMPPAGVAQAHNAMVVPDPPAHSCTYDHARQVNVENLTPP
jgi:hypothetical protein